MTATECTVNILRDRRDNIIDADLLRAKTFYAVLLKSRTLSTLSDIYLFNRNLKFVCHKISQIVATRKCVFEWEEEPVASDEYPVPTEKTFGGGVSMMRLRRLLG